MVGRPFSERPCLPSTQIAYPGRPVEGWNAIVTQFAPRMDDRESTQQQYALVSKATNLHWPSQQIVVIDEDLGLSGTGIAQLNGFARLWPSAMSARPRSLPSRIQRR
jgi:hypothetical protein